MKKAKMILLILILVFGFAGTAQAGLFQGYPTVDLVIDGKKVSSDVPGLLMSGRTMVPLRVISQSFDADVFYDQVTNNVLITRKGEVRLKNIPSSVTGEFGGLPRVGVIVGGSLLTGDVPPVILNGRTLVPVRMVAQALGAKVDFTNNTVYITKPGPVDEDIESGLEDDRELENEIGNLLDFLNDMDL